jgi:SAM-dependent methyltransferase
MEYKEAFTNRATRYDYAIEKYGTALREEFLTALKVLDLKPNESLVNIPAGGIPLDVYIDQALNIKYLAFEPLEGHCEFTAIPVMDSSIDKIITLASFHHVQEKRTQALCEFRRILKDQGTLVIGDVIQGSPQAHWLNVFVNEYNSNGHNGFFLTEAETVEIEKLGFKVCVWRHVYDWTFDNDDNAVDFVRNLFGLDRIPNTREGSAMLLGAMKDILGYKDNKFQWQLMYFRCTLGAR